MLLGNDWILIGFFISIILLFVFCYLGYKKDIKKETELWKKEGLL